MKDISTLVVKEEVAKEYLRFRMSKPYASDKRIACFSGYARAI